MEEVVEQVRRERKHLPEGRCMLHSLFGKSLIFGKTSLRSGPDKGGGRNSPCVLPPRCPRSPRAYGLLPATTPLTADDGTK